MQGCLIVTILQRIPLSTETEGILYYETIGSLCWQGMEAGTKAGHGDITDSTVGWEIFNKASAS